MNKSNWGGKRANAGRPEGSGAYGEKTSSISVPSSYKKELRLLLNQYKIERAKIESKLDISEKEREEFFKKLGLFRHWLSQRKSQRNREVIEVDFNNKTKYRYYQQPVAATPGISPLEQISEDTPYDDMPLGKPEETYLLKVVGNSMINLDIYDGDTLVVEENPDGAEPKNGTIIVADILTQGTVVKIFHRESKEKIILFSANDAYQPIILEGEEQDALIIRSLVKNILRPVTRINPSSYLNEAE